MFQRLHRDEAGKVNTVHYILAVVLIAVGYTAVMYIPPWIQFMKIKRVAAEVALTATTVEGNDERNKNWYDSRIRELGYDFPMAQDLTYIRHNGDRVDLSFEYDYPVKHIWGKTHVLHYYYRCDSEMGHCTNE